MTEDIHGKPATLLVEALPEFKPKFRKLADDALDLAYFADKRAKKAGEDIKLSAFARLAERGPVFERLVGVYYEAGRHDLVEAHFTEAEWGAQLPWREARLRFHEFARLGHGIGAVRCWRHYIRKIALIYWEAIRDRDAALKRAARSKDPEEAEHEVADARRIKLTLMEAYALAERFFEAHGSDRDKAWFARTRAEAFAEERPKPAGKPLPGPMTENLFWSLIEAGGDTALDRAETLADRLADHAAKDIKGFAQIATDKAAEAYRADLWALAYLLMGGCSDDAFTDFRNWLILQGREVFEAALADPDGFDIGRTKETPLFEGLLELAEQAHEMRAGKPLPRLKQPKLKPLSGLDEDRFAQMLPRVAGQTA